MNCRRARSYISAYYDEELSHSVNKELLQHIENCTSCQKEKLLIEQVRVGLKSIPKDELSTEFNDKLFARIYSAPRTEETRLSVVPSVLVYRLRMLSPLLAAACVVFLLAWIGISQISILNNDNSGMVQAENQLIQKVNDRPMSPEEKFYRYSNSSLALEVAKFDSLQIATSLQNNRLMFDRLRLEAISNFGGFNNVNYSSRPTTDGRPNSSWRYVYPVIRNAGTNRNPY
jgi:anti-sigma factor RsiW